MTFENIVCILKQIKNLESINTVVYSDGTITSSMFSKDFSEMGLFL